MNHSNINNWSDNESEDEYDNEYMEENVKREDPLPELNPDFRKNVLQVKHSLYNNIVISPELGTDHAQDNKVLQDYLEKLNKVYIMSISAENGKKIPDHALLIFPEESRNMIRATLDWILDFFNSNHISETVPYSDHIRKSFHDYQFVQNNSFEDD
jgi:hypothetical protein